MKPVIRKFVEQRAAGRCEYCHAPGGPLAYTLHVEHIHPRSAGGANDPSNYALACAPCNAAKGKALSGFDPETQSDQPLFNPRRDVWDDHFHWNLETCAMEGRTPTGHATIARMKLNAAPQIAGRQMWRELSLWP